MKKILDFHPVIRENHAWWLQKMQHFTKAELEDEFIDTSEPMGVVVSMHKEGIPSFEMIIRSYPGKEDNKTGNIEIKIGGYSSYDADAQLFYERKNMVYKDIFDTIEVKDIDFTKMKLPECVYNIYPEIKENTYDVKISLLIHDFLHEPSKKIFFTDRKEKKEEKKEVSSIEFDNVSARNEYRRKSNYLDR